MVCRKGDVEVLQGADLVQAELALRQDLDGDGFKGIQIAGTEPLGMLRLGTCRRDILLGCTAPTVNTC